MDLPHSRLAPLVVLLAAVATADDAGVIARPTDRAALEAGEIEVIARAANGRLELDGEPLEAEEPFPGVLLARPTVAVGEHALALIWDGGRREIAFFAGPDPTPGFEAFRPHPPLAGVACSQCHGVSRRGRFRFTGGCFDCHQKDAFIDTHAHQAHVLERCGLCHNAHGSTAAAHLILDRETACRQCHGL